VLTQAFWVEGFVRILLLSARYFRRASQNDLLYRGKFREADGGGVVVFLESMTLGSNENTEKAVIISGIL